MLWAQQAVGEAPRVALDIDPDAAARVLNISYFQQSLIVFHVCRRQIQDVKSFIEKSYLTKDHIVDVLKYIMRQKGSISSTV